MTTAETEKIYRAFLDDEIDSTELPEPKWGAIGKEVFERTYSRPIYKIDPLTDELMVDDTGNKVLQDWWVWKRPTTDRLKETWGDACRRISTGSINLAKEQALPDELYKLFSSMYEFKLTPAGRHLWVTGTGSPFTKNCFAGETKIITKEGDKTLGELVGQTVEILDGNSEWVLAPVKSFGKQHLLKLTVGLLEERKIFYVTPDHDWFVDVRGNTRKVHTQDLNQGDHLISREGDDWVVLLVEDTQRDEEVFCLEVPTTHSFLLEGGILTSNCWVSPVGPRTSDHFHFAASRLFEGGGVGSNYSTDLWDQTQTVQGNLELKFTCKEDHADYAKVVEAAGPAFDLDIYGGKEVDPSFEHFIVEDTREGWADCWAYLVDLAIEPGTHKVIIDVSNLRKYGSPLRTFGGQASGPDPLVTACLGISAVLNRANGRKLNGLEAMEIDHQIAMSVVAGGTRRSARMSLMKWDDPLIEEFLSCKIDPSKHWTTNISVEVNKEFRDALNDENHPKHSKAKQILKGIARGMARDGEPGIVDTDQLNEGEPEPLRMTNPCLAGDSFLVTDEGLMRYVDAINHDTLVIATDSRISYEGEGEEIPANWKIECGRGHEVLYTGEHPRMTQPMASLVKVMTNEGFEVRLTPDHHIATVNGMVEAGSLVPGDHILITKGKASSQNGNRMPETLKEKLAAIAGLIAGDGSLITQGENRSDLAYIYIWNDDQKVAKVKEWVEELFEAFKDEVIGKGNRSLTAYNEYTNGNGRTAITSTFVALMLNREFGMNSTNKKFVPSSIMAQAKTSIGHFYLAGLFYADGTVNISSKSRASVRLSQSNRNLLIDIQRMLLANGIYSTINSRRPEMNRMMPDGKGGLKEYSTQENFDLIVNSDRELFAQTIGFLGSSKDEKILSCEYKSYNPESYHYATVLDVIPDGEEPVYCISEPITRSQVVNGIAMRRCGEATLTFDPGSLKDKISGAGESCNLGSANMAAFGTDIDGLLEATRLLTRFLYRATLLQHPSEPARRIEDRNRRIGVGFLGLQGFCLAHDARLSELPERKDLQDILIRMRKEARSSANELADELGLPRPVKVTAVAPTGTIAQLSGVTPGMSPVMYKHFIRRVRYESNNPKLEELEMQGYIVEPDVYAKNTSVVEFPVVDAIVEQYPDKIDLIEDSTEIPFSKFMDLVTCVQNTFCAGEDGQAVSSTAQLPSHADEDMIAAEIMRSLGKVKGITAFPALDESRPQMPYERLSEEEYLNAKSYIMDDSTMVGDSNDGSCGVGGCPVV